MSLTKSIISLVMMASLAVGCSTEQNDQSSSVQMADLKPSGSPLFAAGRLNVGTMAGSEKVALGFYYSHISTTIAVQETFEFDFLNGIPGGSSQFLKVDNMVSGRCQQKAGVQVCTSVFNDAEFKNVIKIDQIAGQQKAAVSVLKWRGVDMSDKGATEVSFNGSPKDVFCDLSMPVDCGG